jgi:AbiV family abortive infection protein
MSGHNERRPEPGKQLFDNLFVRRSGDTTLDMLSAGLTAVLNNASRLIEDVALLADSRRYASAAFLLATANEEMAKSFILIDTCRLDFSRHQDVLKRLCRAFYNHITKYAYNKVVRRDGFVSMSHVKEIWDIGVTRWWPSSDPESGWPDMPHDTYVVREMPLYVDFIDPDQKWFVPATGTRKEAFEEFLGTSDLSKSKEALERLCKTSEAGFYKPECLSILNETFKRCYITETTKTDEIGRLYEKVAERLERELGLSRTGFFASALHEWPLYHFVSR